MADSLCSRRLFACARARRSSSVRSITAAQDGRALEFTDRNGLWLGTLLARDCVARGVRTARADRAGVRSARCWRPRTRASSSTARSIRWPRRAPLAARCARGGSGRRVDDLDAARAHRRAGRCRARAASVEEVVDALRLENARLEARDPRGVLQPRADGRQHLRRRGRPRARTSASTPTNSTSRRRRSSPRCPTIRRGSTRTRTGQRCARASARARSVWSPRGFIVPAEARARRAPRTSRSRRDGGGIVGGGALPVRRRAAGAAPARASCARRSICRCSVSSRRRCATSSRALGDHDVHDAAAIVVDNRPARSSRTWARPTTSTTRTLGRNDGVHGVAPARLRAQAVPLRARARAPRDPADDDPPRRTRDVRDPRRQTLQPGDYSGRFAGRVRVRIALADSLNVPAVRVLERVGVERVPRRGCTRSASRTCATPPTTTVSGSTSAAARSRSTNWRGAYAGWRAAARRRRSTRLPPTRRRRRGCGADGAGLGTGDRYPRRPARARRVVRRRSVLALPFAAAVKTGTSSDFRDTWTVGFTRDYTVGGVGRQLRRPPMRARLRRHGSRRRSGAASCCTCTKRANRPVRTAERLRAAADLRGYGRASGHGMPRRRDRVARPRRSRRLYASSRAARGLARSSLIAFPNDGDRFVLLPGGGPQRIVVQVQAAQPDRVEASSTGAGCATTAARSCGRFASAPTRSSRARRRRAASNRRGAPPARRAGFTALGR